MSGLQEESKMCGKEVIPRRLTQAAGWGAHQRKKVVDRPLAQYILTEHSHGPVYQLECNKQRSFQAVCLEEKWHYLKMGRSGEVEARFGCVELEWVKTQLGIQAGALERGQEQMSYVWEFSS